MNPYGNRSNPPNYLNFNNNPIDFINRFNQFRKTFQGNPKDIVMNMLNSGQMSQNQFNQLQELANQIINNSNG